LATLAADGSHAADDVEYVRLRNTPHLLQKPRADAQLIWHERREQASERAGERLSERASEQEGAVFTDQYGRSSGRETARRQERTRALTRPAVSSLQPTVQRHAWEHVHAKIGVHNVSTKRAHGSDGRNYQPRVQRGGLMAAPGSEAFVGSATRYSPSISARASSLLSASPYIAPAHASQRIGMARGTRSAQTGHAARVVITIAGRFTSSGSDLRVTETSLDDLNEVTRGALSARGVAAPLQRRRKAAARGKRRWGKRTGKLTGHAAEMSSPGPPARTSARMAADMRLKREPTIKLRSSACEKRGRTDSSRCCVLFLFLQGCRDGLRLGMHICSAKISAVCGRVRGSTERGVHDSEDSKKGSVSVASNSSLS
jgi:hypothetical protein